MEFVKIEDLISYQIKGLWGEEFDDSFHCTPVIKTNNMNYDGTIDLDNLTYRNIKHDSILENYLQKGDLLIEKSGGTKTHSVGYVTYFDGEEKKYVCNNFILGLRPDTTKINSKYLFYNLKYMYENGDFSDCYNKTTGIQNLKVKFYLAKKIKLIELSKQSEIIEVLDSITKQISSFKSLLENLDNIVKSQFIEMFGDRYNNDKHWKVELLKNCTEFYNGKAHEQVVDDAGEYILITSKCISTNFMNYRRTNSLLFPLEKNDIVMVMSDVPNGKAFAKCALIEKSNLYTLNQRICCLRNYDLNSIFFKELLNRHEYFMRFDDGQNQTNLRKNDLLECPIICPPIELQNKFAEFVQQIDKSKFIVQKQIKLLEELLEKKMNEYFGQ